MSARVLLSLARDAALEPRGEDLHLCSPRHALTIRAPSAEIRAALAALASGRATEDEIVAAAGTSAPMLFVHLDGLARRGLISFTAASDEGPLAVLVPTSPHAPFPSASLDEQASYRLSRFVHLRCDADRPALECPTSLARVIIEDRRVLPLLFDLAQPTTVNALARRAAPLDSASVRAVLSLLALAAMLTTEEAEALRTWEPHDLYFHARSRIGRHAAPVGRTYRFADQTPPLPAIKPALGGAPIALYRPDIEALRRADVPFTEVVERRRSLRGPPSSPLTARHLGELLYRSARLRRLLPSAHGELSDRPYPGAGACYELELYPVIDRCEGLPPGLYHYDPEAHALDPLARAPRPLVEALLDSARASAGAPARPEVLMVIAARFARIAWKYESIAYALILKDTGVLLQTMLLVASAMGLSACALGAGDADLFSRAAGTDYYEETSVGEMMLGGPGTLA